MLAARSRSLDLSCISARLSQLRGRVRLTCDSRLSLARSEKQLGPVRERPVAAPGPARASSQALQRGDAALVDGRKLHHVRLTRSHVPFAFFFFFFY